ncbi:MAG: MFS transporter [Aquincola sp.]|uniref:MFS transporter n=1 Tax=uncultured Aquincola sp. TaxID=886556 RepID=UPI0032B2D5C7|nr:MFS transporter [Aquincola sp.]
MTTLHSPLDARTTAATAGTVAPRTRVVAATVAGNALEFYDFVTYAFFAVYIGRTFFPADTPLASLLMSVAVFGVGFVSRPLGGVLIGAYADRAGRKPAMLLTIGLITVGTLGLALTPGHAQIGLAAPVIVVLCRLVQGLALGGEVGPSTAFLIEIAPPHRRGAYAGWQLASQGLATLVAGGAGLAVTTWLTPAQVESWGWRLPFVFGLLLLPVAVYLRRHMTESMHAPAAGEAAGWPLVWAQRRVIGVALLVVMGATVANYVGTFMTTYAITTLKFAPGVAMGATVMVGAITLVGALLGGWLSDRWGRRAVMLWPRIGTALVAVPAFSLLVAHPTQGMLLASTAVLALLTAISGSASIIAIPELLPKAVRATGLSIAYALGVTVFGGTTQFIVTALIASTGNPAAPAWYVAATSAMAALAILVLPESRGRALR